MKTVLLVLLIAKKNWMHVKKIRIGFIILTRWNAYFLNQTFVSLGGKTLI